MQQAGLIEEYFENFFRLSSWNGKKVLLACALASRENKRLPIRTLCAADQRMSFDYAFGYLIAASSGGYFTVQSDPPIHLLEIKGFSEINFGYLIKHIKSHLSIPEHDRANKLRELNIITDTLGVAAMNFS